MVFCQYPFRAFARSAKMTANTRWLTARWMTITAWRNSKRRWWTGERYFQIAQYVFVYFWAEYLVYRQLWMWKKTVNDTHEVPLEKGAKNRTSAMASWFGIQTALIEAETCLVPQSTTNSRSIVLYYSLPLKKSKMLQVICLILLHECDRKQ